MRAYFPGRRNRSRFSPVAAHQAYGTPTVGLWGVLSPLEGLAAASALEDAREGRRTLEPGGPDIVFKTGLRAMAVPRERLKITEQKNVCFPDRGAHCEKGGLPLT